MKFWTLTGIGFSHPTPNKGVCQGWEKYTYLIKAATIEAAHKLFNSVVTHNSFEGFKEAVRPFEACDVDLCYIAGDDEAIWGTPRYGADTRLV